MTNSLMKASDFDVDRSVARFSGPIPADRPSVPDTPPNTFSQKPKTVIRMKQLQDVIGLKRSAIYYLMGNGPRRDPDFPPAIKLSRHAIGFFAEDVESWLESRKAQSKSKTCA